MSPTPANFNQTAHKKNVVVERTVKEKFLNKKRNRIKNLPWAIRTAGILILILAAVVLGVRILEVRQKL